MLSSSPPLSSLCRRRRRRRRRMCFLLSILFLLSSACSSLEEEAKALRVGEELAGEAMPLRRGRRFYRLAGLRPPAWYEIKISYPTSIPSSFSIRIVNDPHAVEDWGSKNRRLLNTEKMIFKAESTKPVYVLVTVEPEGVVAKPNVPERELALFNIVCDELVLGIPILPGGLELQHFSALCWHQLHLISSRCTSYSSMNLHRVAMLMQPSFRDRLRRGA